jgi:hypothetical protein
MLPPSRFNEPDVPVEGVMPIDRMVGDDAEDTSRLQKMAADAETYIRSFSWCRSVCRSFFGGGVGGIFAVFLFNIDSARPDVDQWIWIVVGDIPPAYVALEDAKSPSEVFKTYLSGMTRWVEYAQSGQTGPAGNDIPPVNVPATPEWAETLEQRLNVLRLMMPPFFNDEESSAVQ